MKAATKFSFLVLEHFFQIHQDRFETFYKDPGNVELWEEIFEHFFQTRPEDTVVTKHPLKRRPGSCDPKWDTLFFTLNAFKAQKLLVKLKERERRKTSPSLKEAA